MELLIPLMQHLLRNGLTTQSEPGRVLPGVSSLSPLVPELLVASMLYSTVKMRSKIKFQRCRSNPWIQPCLKHILPFSVSMPLCIMTLESSPQKGTSPLLHLLEYGLGLVTYSGQCTGIKYGTSRGLCIGLFSLLLLLGQPARKQDTWPCCPIAFQPPAPTDSQSQLTIS